MPAKAATWLALRIADRRVMSVSISFLIRLSLADLLYEFFASTIDFSHLELQNKIQVDDGRAAPQGRARTRAELSERGRVQEVHNSCRRREVVSVEKHLLRGVYVHTER